VDEEAKGLALAKSFDSYEATLRLAMLTGMEKELETFSTTQKMMGMQATTTPTPIAMSSRAVVSDPNEASATSSLHLPGKAPAPSANKARSPRYTYLWIVSALSVAVAVALYLLR
jgi:hypothetical protein